MTQSLINLSKVVKANLDKVTKIKIKAQVALLNDVSYSAKAMHENGITQRLFDRLFAVAFEFDDNATLDAWAFDSEAHELIPVVESMFGTYVNKHIVSNFELKHKIWNGTNYAPGIQAVIEHYYPSKPKIPKAELNNSAKPQSFFGKIGRSLFGKNDNTKLSSASIPASIPSDLAYHSNDPIYCMMVTDGENCDRAETIRTITEHKDKNIFWQIIGITDRDVPNFNFLEQLAKDFTNVDFYNAGQIDHVSNDTLYGKIFTSKFISWYEMTQSVV
jgi:hypothetical protein